MAFLPGDFDVKLAPEDDESCTCGDPLKCARPLLAHMKKITAAQILAQTGLGNKKLVSRIEDLQHQLAKLKEEHARLVISERAESPKRMPQLAGYRDAAMVSVEGWTEDELDKVLKAAERAGEEVCCAALDCPGISGRATRAEMFLWAGNSRNSESSVYYCHRCVKKRIIQYQSERHVIFRLLGASLILSVVGLATFVASIFYLSH